uniref:Protein exportin 1A n=1 Tax=Tanacetum cinerariifolium TaxID=118510 RepID=A0A6L2JG60_TANCI|nr:protein exportin 1A [Tanacetum cinerariifolium]
MEHVIALDAPDEYLQMSDRTSHISLNHFSTSVISVKRETLKLIETFLDKAEYQPQIRKHRVPLMTDPVLGSQQPITRVSAHSAHDAPNINIQSHTRQSPNVEPITFANNVGYWEFCDNYCDIVLNLSSNRQCVRQSNRVSSHDSRLNTPSVSAASGSHSLSRLTYVISIFNLVLGLVFELRV